MVRDLAIQWAGRFIANSSFLILLFLPSLTAAAAQLMYEVPLGCILAIWAWLTYKATATGDRQSLQRRKVHGVVAGFAGLALGVAICIQPKVIPLAIVGLIILWGASSKAARIFYVVGAGLLPVIVTIQNDAKFGHWGISWNAGTTMSLRNEGRLVGCEPWADMFSRDESLVACNLRADLADPLHALYLYGQQAVWHLWPLSGPQPSESTWFHGLTPWRFVTLLCMPAEVSQRLEVVWGVLAALFVAVPFILGVFAARRLPWRLTVLLASSPALLLIVSMLVRGDGRFRIPRTLLGMPFGLWAPVWPWRLSSGDPQSLGGGQAYSRPVRTSASHRIVLPDDACPGHCKRSTLSPGGRR